MGYLYVIAASEQGPVKLGRSATPQKRLKQLQTGSQDRLQLFYSVLVESDVRLEKELHRLNRHLRRKGEWFDMTVKDAIGEINHVCIFDGDQCEYDI